MWRNRVKHDIAIMIARDAESITESEACPVAKRMGGEKWLENTFAVLHRNSSARVFDYQDEFSAAALARHPHPLIRGRAHCLKRIGQEVGEGTSELGRIGPFLV